MADVAPIVHLIDDDDSVRKAVARLLKAAGHSVQCYANAGDFLLSLPSAAAGCVVLDVRMPGPSGLELHAAIKRLENPLPVIFLTGHGDIPMSVQAIKAGAVDFLTKPVQRQALMAAVEQALATQRLVKEERQRLAHIRACYESLTDRERETFHQVVQGKLNKQIATQMGIAERTVKAHRAQVMDKMRVATLADLVRVAEELGKALHQSAIPPERESNTSQAVVE
ncbi:MAG: response regulator transcription factor [Planctomycetota bacterium]